VAVLAGLVRELLSRSDTFDFVSRSLQFPWNTRTRLLPLEEAVHMLIAEDLKANATYPPYDRSLRDGYAVRSEDIVGASSSFPVFLKLGGTVPMGEIPSETVGPGSAVEIFTGGILPPGADAVVMMEDTVTSGKWLEVRRSVQRGEYIIRKGEEVEENAVLMQKGSLLDFRNFGILSTFGFRSLQVIDLRIGIISTGDEIVPVETAPLPKGKVRDVNTWTLVSLFSQNGFSVKQYGIIEDQRESLSDAIQQAYKENDVVVISGGSSVSVRDLCSDLLEEVPDPGLLVRGIQIRPGKPTLIAGSMEEKKLVVGLPGHPLSCAVVAYTVLLPLLSRLITADNRMPWQTLVCPVGNDIHGKTGIEEFIPFLFDKQGKVIPQMAKSGYIRAMNDSAGLIRLSESVETVRKGEKVEVLLW
jgi:molybdopterin molybdotransferase